MNEKGFTLIELLAVIVVLAIIALIAMPLIMNVIDEAKIGAAISSGYEYIRTVELEAVNNMTQRGSKLTGEYIIKNSDLYDSQNNLILDIEMKGQQPEDGGIINITSNIVTDGKITVGGYELDYDGENLTSSDNQKIPGTDEETGGGNSDTLTGTAIGTITDTLLANNTTYNYMDGTYLKGNITNNFIWYNGFMWQIMGKNSDGSIRMISADNVTAIPWGTASQGYSSSYVKKWANNYFYARLKDTSTIVNTNFCEDTTAVSSSTSARTTCSTPVAAKVGILSLDEYNLAGGSSGYLENDQYFWTLTPEDSYDIWYVGTGTVYEKDAEYEYGVRVVISVAPNTVVTAGNGTLTANSDTEYILNQKLDNVTGKLSEKSGSGEYVRFDGKTYRVIEHTEAGTKLILDDVYDNTSRNDSSFNTMNTLLTGSTFLNWLAPTKQSQLLNTTWYRGAYWTGGDYVNNLNSTSNPYAGKVALPKVGELLSGQSFSMLSNNYSEVSTSISSGEDYWTMTAYNSSNSWYIDNNGNMVMFATILSVRPVIMLSLDTAITTGNGTLSNPYQL